jgi:hypothetical protein
MEIVCPLEDSTLRTQKTLFEKYLQVAGAGAAVLTLSWIALRLARHKRHV